jgi:hypothetical protein
MVTVGPTSGMEQVKQTLDASSVQSNPALLMTSLPDITLLSGHSLKSDDTIRKLVAKFTSDNKWDSSSGTAHMVYEFTWCDNEVAETCVTNEVSSMVDAFDNVQDDNVQDDTDSKKIDESNNDDTFWGISKSQTSRN